MNFTLEFIQSPNYTPGSQTRAIYGRARTIEFGAGHWWGDPNAGYSHQGVINTFLNPARQASAHAVVSAGRVTEMVRDGDTAWATNNANPYTFAIECDPRIVLGGAVAEAIMKTLTEYIAYKNFQGLEWSPHKRWWNTGCNPIDWGEVRRRAGIERQAIDTPAAPAAYEVARESYEPALKKFRFNKDSRLYNLIEYRVISDKVYTKGTEIDLAQKLTLNNGNQWYRTKYSNDAGVPNGFRAEDLEAVEVAPEWQRNLVDITDVKLYVLPAAGTPVINLNTGEAVPDSVIAKGTAVDIAKSTIRGGKKYLLSSYSVTNSMPNGILADDLGELAKPPVNEKPEWLQNLEDVKDVTGYTRAEVPLVNLLDGSTIKMLPINTPIEIAEATEWHGQRYFISKYAAEKDLPNGILVAHIADEPIKDPEEPATPAPEQPTIEFRLSKLEQVWSIIKAWLKDKFNIDLGV